MNLQPRVEKLVSQLEDASKLVWAAAALHLDTMTNTPEPARNDRALVTAKVEKLAEQEMRNPEIMGQLNELVSDEVLMGELSKDPEQATLIRVLQRTFKQMHTVPEHLRMRFIELKNTAEPVWEKAKKTSDFPLFLPYLKEMVHLQRQMAGALGHQGNPYDALLGRFDPGMTAEKLKTIFGRIKPGLIKLAQNIVNKDLEKPSFIGNGGSSYDNESQMKLSKKVMGFLLFDYDKGGPLSVITHPMCTTVGKGDTRITTRFLDHNPLAGLMSTAHENGHAGFHQGVDETIERFEVDGLYSLSVHESQSRLYENLVCRGREFWSFFRPTVQQVFPQLKEISPDELYLAVNWVEPSLVRIEADEVTYNLHVIIRFELEEALITGSLEPEEAPGAWNALYRKYLGLTPPDDARGILQDVHWAHGYVGYFPTYVIGSICSVLVYQKALQELPEIPSQMAVGNFRPLREWLQKKIHRFGYLHSADEILRSIGMEMNPEAYLEYLSEKYSGIYGAL